VRLGFSSRPEDDGESPEVAEADYLPEMSFGKQPGRRDPALDHTGITPARDVVGSLLNAALWAFDDVGCAEAFRAKAEASAFER
jgi:hypothetical protein